LVGIKRDVNQFRANARATLAGIDHAHQTNFQVIEKVIELDIHLSRWSSGQGGDLSSHTRGPQIGGDLHVPFVGMNVNCQHKPR
jgi:hypothetical protein